MKVYLHSVGCRLNRGEIEALARRLTAAGHFLVSEPADADVCAVNTCAVTAQAERKSRRLLRAIHRANPGARIAALGCYATLTGQQLLSLPGVAWVLPNSDKEGAAETITRRVEPETTTVGQARELPQRTRAFLKVQEGCDCRCAYCVTRILRGPSRSKSLPEVVSEVQELGSAGYHEVVLTGVNLGSYGRDLGAQSTLSDLIAAVLERTDIRRLRVSSLEPWDVDGPLIRLWSDPRLCRHFHIPLQSGFDETLRRMDRRGDCATYANLVSAIRRSVPDAAITTDVMVGFPGETDAHFQASLDFTAGMGFARLHVFSFSPRPGTEAAAMPDQVPRFVRRERARLMRELGEQQSATFQQAFVGQELEVLWERPRADGLWQGLTDNYLRVVTDCPADLHNRIARTRLHAGRDGFLVGEIKSWPSASSAV